MISRYADTITWTDHAQGRTFKTPQEFRDDFLPGWVQASSDIRISGPRYLDAGQTVVCTFTVAGTHDVPLRPNSWPTWPPTTPARQRRAPLLAAIARNRLAAARAKLTRPRRRP